MAPLRSFCTLRNIRCCTDWTSPNILESFKFSLLSKFHNKHADPKLNAAISKMSDKAHILENGLELLTILDSLYWKLFYDYP